MKENLDIFDFKLSSDELMNIIFPYLLSDAFVLTGCAYE